MAIIFKEQSEDVKTVSIDSLKNGDTFYRPKGGSYYVILDIGDGHLIRCCNLSHAHACTFYPTAQVEPVDIEMRPVR